MRPSLITQTPSKKFDGARPSRTAGVLRPGIRRLTAKARNDPKALAAYKAALATGGLDPVARAAAERLVSKHLVD